jgi:hypothetical protein
LVKRNYCWFLVWNIWIIFPYTGNVIIPTDYYFSRWLTPPTNMLEFTNNTGAIWPTIDLGNSPMVL